MNPNRLSSSCPAPFPRPGTPNSTFLTDFQRGCLCSLLCLIFDGFTVHAQTVESLVGNYRREPVENPWHEGEIRIKPDSDGKVLEWMNKAGATWNLLPNLAHDMLRTDNSNPYFNDGGGDFVLQIEDGEVIGFTFRNDDYYRPGAKKGGV